MNINRFTRTIAAVAVGILLTNAITPATPAAAADSLQRQIDSYLATHPGGTQINATDLSYSSGQFIVTFGRPPAGAAAATTSICPSGWFCFFTDPDYGGLRGKLSSCGWQDLAYWGWDNQVMSAYYNLSTGSVDFLNHVGSGGSHATDTVEFTIGTSRRGAALVMPTADHVNRHC
ncbi:peptidase inhibitor family I36 protein [Hamadaea tsunoensis]|uniref:peptidase inhibitor family I36 protein n=1 Tax=Hamadaea tsunoensis TaxID=53368 RepID=UPI00041DAD6F|nr:peptidase inhibitor family I36 protein [Hamadaea tsunoensis]